MNLASTMSLSMHYHGAQLRVSGEVSKIDDLKIAKFPESSAPEQVQEDKIKRDS